MFILVFILWHTHNYTRSYTEFMWYIQLNEYLYLSKQTLIRDCMYVNMKIIIFEDFMRKYNLKKNYEWKWFTKSFYL